MENMLDLVYIEAEKLCEKHNLEFEEILIDELFSYIETKYTNEELNDKEPTPKFETEVRFAIAKWELEKIYK